MKILTIAFTLLIFFVFVFPLSAFSADVVTGKIIEKSPDSGFIQVGDSLYQVTNVWRDNGVADPVRIGRNSLKLGSVVMITESGKTTDYYRVEKIVLLVGLKRKEALVTMSSD